MGSVRAAVRPAEAIVQIVFDLGLYGEGEIPVWLDRKPNPARYYPCRAHSGARIARWAAYQELEHSAEVAVGLPRTAEFVYRSSVLWAWTSSPAEAVRAKTFKPVPHIVLRIGNSSERLLLWVLNAPASEAKTRLYCERISYCLKAPRTRCTPEELRVPLPGTFMRLDRGKPAPVLVTRLADVDRGLDVEQIAGNLREPPPRDAWRERQKRG